MLLYFQPNTYCHMRSSLPILLLLGTLHTIAQPVKHATRQPVLGYRSAAILKVDGLQFKDLNRNGKLDKYEDWRLSNEERSSDLLSKMSVEDKVGFMLISTASMKNERADRSEFNEEDRVSTNNFFTRKPLPEPMMSVAGTTKGVT